MNEERELVQRVKSGDQKAFRELVERFKQQIYYLALDLSGNHHDAEDISQEVFVKVYRGIGKFRSGSKLSTWLYRITVNTYIDSKRKKSIKMESLFNKRNDSDVDPLDVAADGITGNPELSVNAVDINQNISRALKRLSKQEQTVFIMRHYHDLPLKEISSVLNIADGTVKSLLFKSVRKLRDQLAVYKEELGLGDPN